MNFSQYLEVPISCGYQGINYSNKCMLIYCLHIPAIFLHCYQFPDLKEVN